MGMRRFSPPRTALVESNNIPQLQGLGPQRPTSSHKQIRVAACLVEEIPEAMCRSCRPCRAATYPPHPSEREGRHTKAVPPPVSEKYVHTHTVVVFTGRAFTHSSAGS